MKPGENEWTFGQTLAMLLLVLPVWEAGKTVRECFHSGRAEEVEMEETV